MSRRTPVVRVTVFDGEMCGALVAILETLDVAGLIDVHHDDMDGGACFDIPTQDFAQAFKLIGNLQAWHLNAELALSGGEQ